MDSVFVFVCILLTYHGPSMSYPSANKPICSLTQGTFVLISGRLGAIYGHQKMLLIGGFFLSLCTILNGFATNFEMFIALRALAGIGGGLLMPNAVALLMMMSPPGKARNITMGFFGASAPIGGWIGALFSGIFIKFTSWQYLFYFWYLPLLRCKFIVCF